MMNHIKYFSLNFSPNLICISRIRVKDGIINCFEYMSCYRIPLDDTLHNSLARIPLALLSFCLSVFIYSLNDRCSSMITPNNLVQRFGSIFCQLSLKFKFLCICFVDDLKTTFSVLLTFKDILFALSHWTRLERSKLNVLFKFLREWLLYKKFVSSAKWSTLRV